MPRHSPQRALPAHPTQLLEEAIRLPRHQDLFAASPGAGSAPAAASLVCECHLQGSPVPQLLVCPDPAAPQSPTSNEGKSWSKQNPLPCWAAPGREQPGHGDMGRVAEEDRGDVASVFSLPLIHKSGMRRMRSRCESQGTPLVLFWN